MGHTELLIFGYYYGVGEFLYIMSKIDNLCLYEPTSNLDYNLDYNLKLPISDDYQY